MRRTAREPERDRVALILVWALVAGLVLFTPPHAWIEGPARSWVLGGVLLAVALLGLVVLTAWVFVTRATLAEGTLTLRALRRRERLSVPFDAVVGYHMDKAGAWWVHTRPEGTSCTDPAARTRVAVRDPWELHRAFVDLAPKRLGGRRWRFPGEPPAEEFRGLWTFDVERFARSAGMQIAGSMTGVLLGFLLTHRRGLGAISPFVGILLVPLVYGWERLDVTDAGLTRRSPLGRQAIRWAETRAIFREGPPDRRSFVLVGPNCAIAIPAHLATDFELMKKVLYSLPDPILCVNFDETTRGGYKVRKKAEEPVRNGDLLSAPTA